MITKNSWKELEINKTYKNISLSNPAIKRRQCIIIDKLNYIPYNRLVKAKEKKEETNEAE